MPFSARRFSIWPGLFDARDYYGDAACSAHAYAPHGTAMAYRTSRHLKFMLIYQVEGHI